MKKTKSISKVLGVTLIISMGATFIYEHLCQLYGADKVFIAAVLSIPFILIWCLFTTGDKIGKP